MVCRARKISRKKGADGARFDASEGQAAFPVAGMRTGTIAGGAQIAAFRHGGVFRGMFRATKRDRGADLRLGAGVGQRSWTGDAERPARGPKLDKHFDGGKVGDKQRLACPGADRFADGAGRFVPIFLLSGPLELRGHTGRARLDKARNGIPGSIAARPTIGQFRRVVSRGRLRHHRPRDHADSRPPAIRRFYAIRRRL